METFLQNRERIYIVGFKDKHSHDAFSFPLPVKLRTSINDCLEVNVDDDSFYYSADKNVFYSELAIEIKNSNSIYQWRRKYVRENKNGVCPTLTANMGTGGHNVPLILTKKGIRKLTPRECFNFKVFHLHLSYLILLNHSCINRQAIQLLCLW